MINLFGLLSAHPLSWARVSCVLCASLIPIDSTLAQAAPEQQMGQLRLSVLEERSQRALDQVKIIVRSAAVSAERTLTLSTDSSGQVLSPKLVAGLYTVQAQKSGYQLALAGSVRVLAGKVQPVNLTLRRLNQTDSASAAVIVSAPAQQADALSSAGSTYLNREEIRSAVGSGGDVLRALDGTPGLFTSGAFSSFTVRGRGPRDNLILVDGVPFANIVHFDNNFGAQDQNSEGGGRYSVFAPNTIGGAEFQPGGWSAAYGGGAGSLLLVDVAEGNLDSAATSLRLDLTGPEFTYDGPSRVHADTSLLVSARQLNFGRLFESVGVNDLGTPRTRDVIVKTTTALADDGEFSVLFLHAPEQFARDIDNVLASAEDSPGDFGNVLLNRSERDNNLLALRLRSWLSADLSWTNRLYATQLDQRSQIGEAYPDLVAPDTPAAQVPQRPDILRSRQQVQEWGWRSDLIRVQPNQRSHWGLRLVRRSFDLSLDLQDDWIRYVYNQSDFRPDPQQRFIELTPALVNNRSRSNDWLATGFGEQTWTRGRLEYRVGLRYDYDGLSNENLWSPRLGLSWQWRPRWVLNATLGRFFQPPRLEELASDTANANLQNEDVRQLSLGLRHALTPDWELLLESYYQDLQDLIIEGDSVDQRFANTGAGRSHGIDVALNRRLRQGWSVNLSYSYNHTNIDPGGGAPSRPADFARPHAVNIGGVWEINARWKVAARWKWASGLPRDAFVINADVLPEGEPLRFSQEITAQNVNRFAAYRSLNIRVDYRRQLGFADLVSFLDVINVTGAPNPDSNQFDERLGLDQQDDGNALPFIGLRLEW